MLLPKLDNYDVNVLQGLVKQRIKKIKKTIKKHDGIKTFDQINTLDYLQGINEKLNIRVDKIKIIV